MAKIAVPKAEQEEKWDVHRNKGLYSVGRKS